MADASTPDADPASTEHDSSASPKGPQAGPGAAADQAPTAVGGQPEGPSEQSAPPARRTASRPRTAATARQSGATGKSPTAKQRSRQAPATRAPAAPRPAARPAPAKAATATATLAAATGTARASAKGGGRPQILPPKPRLPRAGKTVLDGRGIPVFGTRHGSVEKVDWSALAPEHRRHPVLSFLRHRRWVYATAATDRIFVALAIVDGGISGTAFCMITDLETGETIANSSRPGASRPLVQVSDHPGEGLSASYRLPGTEYRIERVPGSSETRISVRLRSTKESLPGLRLIPGIGSIPLLRDLPTATTKPWLDIDLTLEPTVAPPLTAISPVKADGGLVTSTIKTAAMNTWGSITLHGADAAQPPRTLSLDGGTGGMDYTNGYLPRHTAWQWAYTTGRLADGRLFGLNLVSQFSGIWDEAHENAVWLDGALVPLDRGARVLFDKHDLMKPWTIRTVDGSVHLQFQPLAVHREDLNLGVIRSRFVQPTGLYTGHVMVEGERVIVDRMPGVVENQDILW